MECKQVVCMTLNDDCSKQSCRERAEEKVQCDVRRQGQSRMLDSNESFPNVVTGGPLQYIARVKTCLGNTPVVIRANSNFASPPSPGKAVPFFEWAVCPNRLNAIVPTRWRANDVARVSNVIPGRISWQVERSMLAAGIISQIRLPSFRLP